MDHASAFDNVTATTAGVPGVSVAVRETTENSCGEHVTTDKPSTIPPPVSVNAAPHSADTSRDETPNANPVVHDDESSIKKSVKHNYTSSGFRLLDLNAYIHTFTPTYICIHVCVVLNNQKV